MASARLGVSPISNTSSFSILNTSDAFVPVTLDSSNHDTVMASSKSQLIFSTNHSVTFLSTNFPFFMVKATPVASYNMVPIVARYFFGLHPLAAHTICTGTPSPKSTVVILACRHQDEEHK
jgi:hypothetical protein